MKFALRRHTAGWHTPLLNRTADARVADDPVAAPRYAREPRRSSRVLGWLLALGLGAAIMAVAVVALQDPRSVGTQLDDAVASVRDVGFQAGQTVADSQNAATEASRNVVDGVSTAIDDTGISAKVKAALAVDPALSASRITVQTERGVVRLEGPAPDEAAKQRASVLAAAPQGVRGVDNRLSLPQPGQVVAVADGGQAVVPAVPASR